VPHISKINIKKSSSGNKKKKKKKKKKNSQEKFEKCLLVNYPFIDRLLKKILYQSFLRTSLAGAKLQNNYRLIGY